MKQFIFLYPIPDIIDKEIENHGWSYEEGREAFRKRYKDTLNKCIDERYRQKGFQINYAVFDDTSVSDVINLKSTDKTINVGTSYKKHKTEKKYPDPDYILKQLGEIDMIRIAGFHMWDCVEKLAKKAHEKGLDTLVDEDLTDFFATRIKYCDIKTNKYPSCNLREIAKEPGNVMEARKNKPWLWSDYSVNNIK